MQSMYGVLPYPLGTSHRYGQTTVCRSCSFAFHMSSPYCCDNLTKCVYCCTMCHSDSRSNDIYISFERLSLWHIVQQYTYLVIFSQQEHLFEWLWLPIFQYYSITSIPLCHFTQKQHGSKILRGFLIKNWKSDSHSIPLYTIGYL